MVDSRRPGPSRPPIRLRPAPVSDPPYADESADLWPRPAGQLALDLFGSARQPAGRPTGRRVDPRPGPVRPGGSPHPPGALATATPKATRAAHRFVGTCLEILNGYRPPGQLRALVEPGRAVEFSAELARAATRGGPVRRRAARPTVHLRRLRVCEPRAAAVEVAAVLAGGGRSWAMAVRLEHRRGTWLCTVLQVL
ncbi:Rv3235 family protein [Micromonospora sp. CPCC 205711]|uniref:Rv3235 family protein n=1 Tax=Micromonospora sp. CPCC 205547 TaxID=3122400 RepID=UPI002FF3525C